MKRKDDLHQENRSKLTYGCVILQQAIITSISTENRKSFYTCTDKYWLTNWSQDDVFLVMIASIFSSTTNGTKPFAWAPSKDFSICGCFHVHKFISPSIFWSNLLCTVRTHTPSHKKNFQLVSPLPLTVEPPSSVYLLSDHHLLSNQKSRNHEWPPAIFCPSQREFSYCCHLY